MNLFSFKKVGNFLGIFAGALSAFLVIGGMLLPSRVLAAPGDPVIVSFTRTPSTINLGQSSVLAWNVTGATSISINQGVGTVTGPTGSVSVTPSETAVYTLTATNSAGSVNTTASIMVNKFPVISSVFSSASTTMVVITWTTDEDTTSLVEYGETTAYGSTVSSPLSKISHLMYLTDLVENTTYHFRVSSQNTAGNLTTTGDYTFKTKASGEVGAPAIPAGFANASAFTWGDEVSPGVWNFSATYDWSDPAQLDDITAFDDSMLSLVGGRLQVATGNGVEVHGFRFNQPARIDTCNQSTRLMSGDEITIGFCLTQLSSTYMGGTFNPNPGIVTANALWDSSYEISADGNTVNGGSAGGSMNNWYTYSSIFSDTQISMVRADLGVPYIRNGSFSRDADHYTALGFYNYGNPTIAQYGPVTISGAVKADVVDTTPPVVSSVVSLPLDNSATITWNTNERSTSFVEYGLTTAYGDTSSSSQSVTSHSVRLVGLMANTIYHFRVSSRDISGNIVVSGDDVFTTTAPDTVAPTITSVYPSALDTSATITWTTNESSNSLVEYGIAGYDNIVSSDVFVTAHAIHLTGLTANTLYHFRVTSQDGSGNAGVSQDGLFQTTTSSSILVNYSSVDQFVNLTTTQIQAAAAIRLMFRHASVGGNVSEGLDTLQGQNALYNRTNFNFQARGNPGWSEKLTDFSEQVAIQQSLFDVLTMKFCWIDYEANANAYISTMTNLEALYPTKTFIWWTMPVSVGDTLEQNAAYNLAIRTYALANNKVLFDLASIESHEIDGTPCTSGGIENLCSGYTTDGGHLNAIGEARVAKAFWVLMSHIATRNASHLQTPFGFANASSFTWGTEIAPNVRTFSATYDWSQANQLNDITALNADTALSISGGNLQVNGVGAIEGIHGFRFNQSARIDSCNQVMRFTSGDVISMGSCFTQIPSSYTGGMTYNPNPGLASEDAMWNGTYEVHVNGVTTYGGITGGVSNNMWYNYANTFSDSQIGIVRGDLGVPFMLSGSFTRDISHYGAIGYYAASNNSSVAEYDTIMITGAMQTP